MPNHKNVKPHHVKIIQQLMKYLQDGTELSTDFIYIPLEHEFQATLLIEKNKLSAEALERYNSTKTRLFNIAWEDYKKIVLCLKQIKFFHPHLPAYFPSFFKYFSAGSSTDPEKYIFPHIFLRCIYDHYSKVNLDLPNLMFTRNAFSNFSSKWRKKYKDDKSLKLCHDNTPLMYAVSNTETQEAIRLIAQGADVNKYALLWGTNPILLAVIKGYSHRQSHIITPENNEENQRDIIECLLASSNIDINAELVGNGMNVLHIAFLRGDSLDFIQKLLEHGANPNAHDYLGHKAEYYLDLDYDVVKTEISNILQVDTDGFYAFGESSATEHLGPTITLPTRKEREHNVSEIKEFLNHKPSCALYK